MVKEEDFDWKKYERKKNENAEIISFFF